MTSFGWGVGGTARLARESRAEPAGSPGSSVAWDEIAKRTPMSGVVSGIGRRSGRKERPAAEPHAQSAACYALPASEFDQSVWVRSVVRDGVRLRSPILRVRVSDEDGDGVFVVDDAFSSVYGAGETTDAAISEYVDNLFHHFDVLDQGEAQLAPGLRAELDRLRRYFTRDR